MKITNKLLSELISEQKSEAELFERDERFIRSGGIFAFYTKDFLNDEEQNFFKKYVVLCKIDIAHEIFCGDSADFSEFLRIRRSRDRDRERERRGTAQRTLRSTDRQRVAVSITL